MRRLALSTAAVLAAVFLWLLGTLPPHPLAAQGSVDDDVRGRTVAGAFHVHTTRSDGSEDVESIAAAAARGGLQFVVLTDHGDATRSPAPPEYRNGVLVIDAVEISTNGGHYIALDMPQSPYPLGGEAAAVVEDVRRLGGFGIAAHPDSPKSELQWKDWTLGVDGVEWLNLDSEWRDETRVRLARVAADYAFRKGPALASLLDRPTRTLERWDGVRGPARIVALAGHDAHGGALEGAAGGLTILPSYEASFRTFSVRVVLLEPPSGDAARDARLLLDAIRAGRLFTAIDAIAAPAYVDFRLLRGAAREMGRVVADGAASFFVRSTLPSGGRLILLRDGNELAQSATGSLQAAAGGPGSYRVEIRVEGAPGTPPVPWVVTNPIYVGAPIAEPSVPEPTYKTVARLTEVGSIEKDARSTVSVAASDGGRVLDYVLAPGDRTSQYAALAVPVPPGVGAFDSVSFDAHASAPMRVSVQVRFKSHGGARWIHSVYVSLEERRVVVPVERLLPAEPVATRPDVSTASAVLFVVDLTNARPGQSGRFAIDNLSLTSRSR